MRKGFRGTLHRILRVLRHDGSKRTTITNNICSGPTLLQVYAYLHFLGVDFRVGIRLASKNPDSITIVLDLSKLTRLEFRWTGTSLKREECK